MVLGGAACEGIPSADQNREIIAAEVCAKATARIRPLHCAAPVAQWIEYWPPKPGVAGSIPAGRTTCHATWQAIAQAAFGDSTQWWRIAQANGLQGDRDLRVGQTLTLPSAVSGSSNNTGTFKPYNASDVVGDTSPNLPQPKADKGCGAIGMIVMIVVAAVVTTFTIGAMAGPVAVALGDVGTAAVAATAGSVASQAVGMAIGAQDSFSWKQVGLSALSAGITQGLPVGLQVPGSSFGTAIVRAAVSNAMSQGIAVTVGLQKEFSWRGVAASAAGAAVGQAINDSALGATIQNEIGNKVAAKIVTGTLAGLASGATVALMRGGKVRMQQVAADAFGNALGQGLVEASMV